MHIAILTLEGFNELDSLIALNILNRVMGLVLAAVAVQFVVNGVRDVLPQITAP